MLILFGTILFVIGSIFWIGVSKTLVILGLWIITLSFITGELRD